MAIPAALIPTLIKGTIGAAQTAGGGLMRLTNKRPKYEMPDALRQRFALAQAEYADPYMPGYERAQDNINLGMANAIRSMQESGNVQAGFQGSVAEASAAQRGLAAENEGAQQRDRENLQRVLDAVAQAQDLEFQMNEFAPFADRQQLSEDMIGGGLENIMSSADDFGLASTLGLLGSETNDGQEANSSPAITPRSLGLEEEDEEEANSAAEQMYRNIIKDAQGLGTIQTGVTMGDIGRIINAMSNAF